MNDDLESRLYVFLLTQLTVGARLVWVGPLGVVPACTYFTGRLILNFYGVAFDIAGGGRVCVNVLEQTAIVHSRPRLSRPGQVS